MARNFPTVESKYLRGETVGTDTGYIPAETGPSNPGKTFHLRGVETNTARGVKAGVEIKNVTVLEHAAATDAPEVIPFKTYGEM
jgi:hypothetical protein